MNTYHWIPVPSKLDDVIQFRYGKIVAEIIRLPTKSIYTIYYDGVSELVQLTWGERKRHHDAKRATKRYLERMAENFRLMAYYL